MKTSGWIVVALLAGPAFGAASGRIAAPDGTPIVGAEVCEIVESTSEHCVPADSAGNFRMEQPKRRSLLVRAKGFVPRMIDPATLTAPVTLQPAATLRVQVVDAKSGQPLRSGRVMLSAPSGQRIGEFVPFNQAGVRIGTLAPGPVFVRAEAAGYDPGGPVAVELVGGSEKIVRVTMTKSDGAAR